MGRGAAFLAIVRRREAAKAMRAIIGRGKPICGLAGHGPSHRGSSLFLEGGVAAQDLFFVVRVGRGLVSAQRGVRVLGVIYFVVVTGGGGVVVT